MVSAGLQQGQVLLPLGSASSALKYCGLCRCQTDQEPSGAAGGPLPWLVLALYFSGSYLPPIIIFFYLNNIFKLILHTNQFPHPPLVPSAFPTHFPYPLFFHLHSERDRPLMGFHKDCTLLYCVLSITLTEHSGKQRVCVRWGESSSGLTVSEFSGHFHCWLHSSWNKTDHEDWRLQKETAHITACRSQRESNHGIEDKTYTQQQIFSALVHSVSVYYCTLMASNYLFVHRWALIIRILMIQ